MFVIGATYRRRDLHERLGGQRQGGISTPRDHPAILLFTGESGHQYGYRDGFQADGTYWYTGEGQSGDMKMSAGNLAIRDHHAKGKALHLFEQDRSRGSVRYLGEGTCLGHHLATVPDREGNPRKAIVFELSVGEESPTGAAPDLSDSAEKAPPGLWTLDLAVLRARCLSRAAKDAPPKERRRLLREGSEAIRVYALRRAAGRCEACRGEAPFSTKVGQPFLEVHHVRRRADGGPDHPRWVAALCPNCHRRVHFGANGGEFNRMIASVVEALESS
jgi:5-methylcytosine-specific restriction protein A